MVALNLLPWRERQREERRQRFMVMLGATAGLAGLLLVGAERVLVQRIDSQQARNRALGEQLAVLELKLGEIRQLQQQQRDLGARMAVIQDLQGRRPVIVHVFDELVRTLPDGIHYDRLSRTEDRIAIEGVAVSNSQVSALLRALEESDWFADPDLRQVAAEVPGASAGIHSQRSRFQLTVRSTAPDRPQTGVQP